MRKIAFFSFSTNHRETMDEKSRKLPIPVPVLLKTKDEHAEAPTNHQRAPTFMAIFCPRGHDVGEGAAVTVPLTLGAAPAGTPPDQEPAGRPGASRRCERLPPVGISSYRLDKHAECGDIGFHRSHNPERLDLSHLRTCTGNE